MNQYKSTSPLPTTTEFPKIIYCCGANNRYRIILMTIKKEVEFLGEIAMRV